MTNRTLLVTGASRGIGAATAYELADRETHLILVSRSEGALEMQADRLRARGATVSVVPADLSNADDIRHVVQHCLNLEGGLHGIVLAAGYARTGDFLSSKLEDARYEMRLNYEAPMMLIRSLLPLLLKHPEQAFIVAIASLTALVPFPGHATYSASKGALAGLIRSVGAEFARSPLHVGLVLPGYTETQMTQHLSSAMPAMQPEEVAQAVVKNLTDRETLTIPGFSNKLAAFFFQLFPTTSHSMVRRVGSKLIPRAIS